MLLKQPDGSPSSAYYLHKLTQLLNWYENDREILHQQIMMRKAKSLSHIDDNDYDYNLYPPSEGICSPDFDEDDVTVFH